MGRKRKDGDPHGLAGTRLAHRRGRFYYIHREGGRWEDVGADPQAAKRAAARYNNPGSDFGTMAYWFAQFVADCKLRVKAGTMSARTLADYTGYAAEAGPLVAAFGAEYPERIAPSAVQAYLDVNATLNPPRPVPANRERAFLSSCIGWLLRGGKVPGLVTNPCLRASGVKRNPERKRERYVTDAEYRAVYAAGNRAVRLAMALTYRTLQRPEVDMLAWTPANVRNKDGAKVLHFRQSKTGHLIDIALTGELGALLAEAIGPVPVLHQPILHRSATGGRARRHGPQAGNAGKAGEGYTYDGLCAMLKQAIGRARERASQAGDAAIAGMAPFGYRDLKGKGATDMWLAGTPVEQIQLLCGHASKTTTEIYIKARWRATAQPNNLRIG